MHRLRRACAGSEAGGPDGRRRRWATRTHHRYVPCYDPREELLRILVAERQVPAAEVKGETSAEPCGE